MYISSQRNLRGLAQQFLYAEVRRVSPLCLQWELFSFIILQLESYSLSVGVMAAEQASPSSTAQQSESGLGLP